MCLSLNLINLPRTRLVSTNSPSINSPLGAILFIVVIVVVVIIIIIIILAISIGDNHDDNDEKVSSLVWIKFHYKKKKREALQMRLLCHLCVSGGQKREKLCLYLVVI